MFDRTEWCNAPNRLAQPPPTLHPPAILAVQSALKCHWQTNLQNAFKKFQNACKKKTSNAYKCQSRSYCFECFLQNATKEEKLSIFPFFHSSYRIKSLEEAWWWLQIWTMSVRASPLFVGNNSKLQVAALGKKPTTSCWIYRRKCLRFELVSGKSRRLGIGQKFLIFWRPRMKGAHSI